MLSAFPWWGGARRWCQKEDPGVSQDGGTLVPPTQPTSETRWHPLSLAAWLSIDVLLKGDGAACASQRGHWGPLLSGRHC